MAIPLAIFYYIYLAFVAFFLLFTLFNVYHLVRFGFLTIGNISITVFYIIISILILVISQDFIGQVDWQQSVSITLGLPI